MRTEQKVVVITGPRKASRRTGSQPIVTELPRRRDLRSIKPSADPDIPYSRRRHQPSRRRADRIVREGSSASAASLSGEQCRRFPRQAFVEMTQEDYDHNLG